MSLRPVSNHNARTQVILWIVFSVILWISLFKSDCTRGASNTFVSMLKWLVSYFWIVQILFGYHVSHTLLLWLLARSEESIICFSIEFNFWKVYSRNFCKFYFRYQIIWENKMTDENETFEEDRKLFVGGLPQEATQDELKVWINYILWMFYDM